MTPLQVENVKMALRVQGQLLNALHEVYKQPDQFPYDIAATYPALLDVLHKITSCYDIMYEASEGAE